MIRETPGGSGTDTRRRSGTCAVPADSWVNASFMPAIAAAMGRALRTSAALRILICIVSLFYSCDNCGFCRIALVRGILSTIVGRLIIAGIEPITTELCICGFLEMLPVLAKLQSVQRWRCCSQ